MRRCSLYHLMPIFFLLSVSPLLWRVSPLRAQQHSTAFDPAPLPAIGTEATPLPLEIAPSDPHLAYIGRFTRDASGPQCSWPASAVRVRLQGSALNVRIEETSARDEYEVLVDGKATAVLIPEAGSHLYRVFQATSCGVHIIELMKRTEAFLGITRIQGFQADASSRMLSFPYDRTRRRRIEVIGDSISCGYGNEGKDQLEHFSSKTENASLTYGALASADLGAEYVCIAWSGRTMWPKNTMGEVYDKTLPTVSGSQWDFSRWIPDIVVINLSTNDFAGGVPDREGWIGGYRAFLAHLRKHYPRATLYCATSPMLGGDHSRIAKDYLAQVVRDEKAAGNTRIHLLVFETQDAANGFGADWHPSVKTHRRMAEHLTHTLQNDQGWKPVVSRF